MNVLVVTPFCFPQTGGVATFIENLGLGLGRRGHRLVILTNGQQDKIVVEKRRNKSISQYSMYLRRPIVPEAPIKGCLAFCVKFVLTIYRLKRFVREQKIDVIALEYPMPYMCYFVCVRLLTGIKVVVGIHGDDILSMHELPKLEQWMTKAIIKDAALLLAHSSAFLAQAKASIESLPAAQFCIPYGIDTEELRHLDEATKGDWQLPDRPYILTVAKLYSRKGIDVLLHAIKLVGDAFAGLMAVIVGDGPEEVALRDLVVKLGLEDRVLFTGELQRSDICALYKNCEFFVLPSRSEPFGIVLLEAMAFGKAIIATQVGGIPEFITHGKNGILVRSEDSKALADAIRLLLENLDLRKDIASRGLDVVEETYRIDVLGERYENALRHIINFPS